MSCDPFAGDGFDWQGLARFEFALLALKLDLADLLNHPCAKQGVFIHKGNADQKIISLFAAPRDNARIARRLAE